MLWWLIPKLRHEIPIPSCPPSPLPRNVVILLCLWLQWLSKLVVGGGGGGWRVPKMHSDSTSKFMATGYPEHRYPEHRYPDIQSTNVHDKHYFHICPRNCYWPGLQISLEWKEEFNFADRVMWKNYATTAWPNLSQISPAEMIDT